MKKSKQQTLKLFYKKCFFCGNEEYNTLDVHRILPGSQGGKYNNKMNTIVACSNCHRLIHGGKIKIDRKYLSTQGIVIHYWIEEQEFWKLENW
jgi:hypothetical protein